MGIPSMVYYDTVIQLTSAHTRIIFCSTAGLFLNNMMISELKANCVTIHSLQVKCGKRVCKSHGEQISVVPNIVLFWNKFVFVFITQFTVKISSIVSSSMELDNLTEKEKIGEMVQFLAAEFTNYIIVKDIKHPSYFF